MNTQSAFSLPNRAFCYYMILFISPNMVLMAGMEERSQHRYVHIKFKSWHGTPRERPIKPKKRVFFSLNRIAAILTLANLVFQASALGSHFEGEIKGK